MKWQQLKVVYVFHCFHQQDVLIHQLHSAMKNHPASMSFLNVASFSGSKFEASLQSLHVGVGLMADLNCDGLAGVLKALSIGAWSTSAGLTMWDKRSVYERRQNLLGMQLTGIAKATDDEHLLALVQKQLTQADTLYYDMAEGLELILRGRVAFLCDAHHAYQMMQTHFTDEQRCALQEVVLISKKSTHLALAKDNPLRELFRVTVHRIAGNGVMQYERSRCYADKPRCAENEVKMPEVNLDQVSSVMVLLLGAIVGSIAVLLLELTHSRVWPRRHRVVPSRGINRKL
ncbi:AGAP013085-PA [Anopheles gambiae str. PEST]|uniref:AGAP013085-PA n=2 Tax=gambiae species complex TaxID=44542 RepID=F5HME0_ANOGA|nr:AGAP013085-PA [Anopheles gambiae str. PEST]